MVESISTVDCYTSPEKSRNCQPYAVMSWVWPMKGISITKTDSRCHVKSVVAWLIANWHLHHSLHQ